MLMSTHNMRCYAMLSIILLAGKKTLIERKQFLLPYLDCL